MLNMRISERIVKGSKGVKSAFTRAEPSSEVVRPPVWEAFAARKRGYRSALSASGGGKDCCGGRAAYCCCCGVCC